MNGSFWSDNRYKLLLSTYIIVTGAAFCTVYRQPYSRAVKLEQIETIFKGTTLAAVLIGFGIDGHLNKSRSSQD
jgi:hypothetical protein